MLTFMYFVYGIAYPHRLQVIYREKYFPTHQPSKRLVHFASNDREHPVSNPIRY
jgi:hypothetical protein